MQVVILAAGRGSRLYPITRNRSKAMLPILGKPMVERVMQPMIAAGLDHFILIVNPADDRIRDYFRSQARLEVDIQFVPQPQPLGSADALQRTAQRIQGDFLLSACDNLVSEEYIRRMLSAWRSEPFLNAILATMPVEAERVSSTGIVTREGPWITGLIEKPEPEQAPSNISCLPLYCFSPRILDYLQEVSLSPRNEYELTDAIGMLIEREGQVKDVPAEWRLTLTHADDLISINRHYLSRNPETLRLLSDQVGPDVQFTPPIWIGPGVRIGDHSRIGPFVYLERDSQIGDRVMIDNAVVLSHARVSDGVEITNQVVMHEEVH